MSSDEARELWMRFVGGEALSDGDQAALVAALEADPELRAALLEDVQLDGTLRAVADARRGANAFTATVVDAFSRERDATRFVHKVEQRLAEPPLEPTGAGRDSRSGLPRVSRRFLRRSDSTGAGWKAALIAACALFAVLLLSTAFAGKPRDLSRAPKPRPGGRQDAPPEPPAPAPAPEPMRLRDIRREVEELEKSPAENPGDRARRLDALHKESEAIEKQMREEIERRRPAPSTTPSAPEETPRPSAPTVSDRAMADAARGPKVVRVTDQVYFAADQKRVPVGSILSYNQAIYTAGSGEAELEYPDRTQVQVRRDTTVRDLSDGRGLRLLVSAGTIESSIQKQPEGRPMVFATPHAEAEILGTKIVLTAGATPKAGTILEVREGKVRFTRSADKQSVDVEAGRSAIASTIQDLKTRVPFPDVLQINFGPSDARIAGWYLDSGETFDPARGYGWDGPQQGDPLPGVNYPDAQGQPKRAGRAGVRRQGTLAADDPMATDLAAGWGSHFETWRIELPNGRYLVKVCVGDPTWEQGPHHVAIQGQQVINMAMTNPPKSFLDPACVVDVKDGTLVMKVGGYPGPAKSPADGSKDTILNYLVIRRVPAPEK
jgi:hypothetical protein